MTPSAARGVWRLYVLLLIANELDLIFTYLGRATGSFVEANPLMAPLLHTFWPVAMKHVSLAGLALGISAALLADPGLRRPTQRALSLAGAAYAAVLLAHALNALVRILPG